MARTDMQYTGHDADGQAKAGAPAGGGLSRRAFALGGAGAAVTLALGGFRFIPKNSLVRPPGGQDEDRLFARCIRCERCYEVCPRDAIRPAHLEDGIIGMRMPEMSFDTGYCNFCADENGGQPLCVAACPTGALQLDDGTKAEKTILGIAELNVDLCLAFRLIGCRFCYDACPYEAMGLDEFKRPYVISDLCNGCGACESVCASLMDGSIAVGAESRAIIVKSAEAYAASTVNRATKEEPR